MQCLSKLENKKSLFFLRLCRIESRQLNPYIHIISIEVHLGSHFLNSVLGAEQYFFWWQLLEYVSRAVRPSVKQIGRVRQRREIHSGLLSMVHVKGESAQRFFLSMCCMAQRVGESAQRKPWGSIPVTRGAFDQGESSRQQRVSKKYKTTLAVMSGN